MVARVSMLLTALLVALTLGCGGPSSEKVTPPEEQPALESARNLLQEIARLGEVGSGAMTLRENLQELNQPGLLADMDALERMTQPAQIQAKAKQMLEKLNKVAPPAAAAE